MIKLFDFTGPGSYTVEHQTVFGALKIGPTPGISLYVPSAQGEHMATALSGLLRAPVRRVLGASAHHPSGAH